MNRQIRMNRKKKWKPIDDKANLADNQQTKASDKRDELKKKPERQNGKTEKI